MRKFLVIILEAGCLVGLLGFAYLFAVTLCALVDRCYYYYVPGG